MKTRRKKATYSRRTGGQTGHAIKRVRQPTDSRFSAGSEPLQPRKKESVLSLRLAPACLDLGPNRTRASSPKGGCHGLVLPPPRASPSWVIGRQDRFTARGTRLAPREHPAPKSQAPNQQQYGDVALDSGGAGPYSKPGGEAHGKQAHYRRDHANQGPQQPVHEFAGLCCAGLGRGWPPDASQQKKGSGSGNHADKMAGYTRTVGKPERSFP